MHTIGILVSVLLVCYFIVYWIVIYIGIDKLSFELSRNFNYFASAKVVYDMFLINIVVMNAILFFKKIRFFYSE
jgi:hypothetical protein